jgi:ABC-type transport system involved in multi-copper enzyme maturation permease subunit
VTEMVRRYLRQKFHSVGVVVALSALALVSAFPLAMSGGMSGFEPGTLALIILAAACVSRDESSGALQMILSRPIHRSEYLLGRFLGVLAGYGAFLLACVGLALLVSRLLPLLTGIPPAYPPLSGLLRGAAGSLLGAMTIAAPILLLSTFLPGYGDVLGYVLLGGLLALPSSAARLFQMPALEKVGTFLSQNLMPDVEWGEVLSGRHLLSEPMGRWLLAVVGYLALADFVFSRREFAYGRD